MLKKFNLINCQPLATTMALNEKLSKNDGKENINASLYRSLVGSLIYLTNTRSDIVHAVSSVSRFMSEPSKLTMKLPNGFSDILKAKEGISYYTKLKRIMTSSATQIVIGQDVKMTEKVQVDMSSCSVRKPSHGLRKGKQ